MLKNLSPRQVFFNHIGQTSRQPLALEIEKAKGIYLFTTNGKKYIDAASGVCVSNLGHNHPAIVKAVVRQAKKHMHLNVYGEYIQQPQVEFAKMLTARLPESLDTLFFVNSGSEAIEGALKTAKRFNQRTEIIAFKNGYHGSTHGALSIGVEKLKSKFRPLLPDIRFLDFNTKNFSPISLKTACVVVEPIQAEAGVILPRDDFLKELSSHCKKHGVLLIFDEVQTGFGRCGSLFAFEKYGVIPDILVIAKAMGGGMPIGGFVSSKRILDCLAINPSAGHITTFGGHPVSSAAAVAALETLINSQILAEVDVKGKLIAELLKNHPKVSEIRQIGLLIAVELTPKKMAAKAVRALLGEGIVTDMFLFNQNSFRIAPPLIISKSEIETMCALILKALDKI